MLQFILSIDSESLVRNGGLILVSALVFCSIGLFFCFFLPVGAVLFATGILTATDQQLPSVYMVCLLLSLAGVAGSLAGYAFGRSTGNFLYTRNDSRFFRRSYLTSTEVFYKKYGTIAIISGYFLPIIRTFAPVLAGVIRMNFRRFLICNVIGSAMFVSVFVLAGYLIGNLPFLRPWLKYIIPVFILAVTIPLVIKIIKELRKPPQNKV